MTMRIPIIPTSVVLAAVATMVALGVWQLGRADEKAAMIAAYDAVAVMPAVDLTNPREASSLEFRSVTVDCSRPWKWEAVAGRNLTGRTGFIHRYACLEQSVNQAENGGQALIEVFGVIGWSASPEQPVWEGGEIVGVLAPLGENFQVISTAGLGGLEAAAPPNPDDLPNNHLAYAGQWFFFALTALVIYFLVLRSRSAKRRED